MLVVLKNVTDKKQSITVHSGELVGVKPGDTIIVTCDHDRFPYYATLKRVGFDVKVREVYFLVETAGQKAEERIVEEKVETKAEPAKVKVESVAVKETEPEQPKPAEELPQENVSEQPTVDTELVAEKVEKVEKPASAKRTTATKPAPKTVKE